MGADPFPSKLQPSPRMSLWWSKYSHTTGLVRSDVRAHVVYSFHTPSHTSHTMLALSFLTVF